MKNSKLSFKRTKLSLFVSAAVSVSSILPTIVVAEENKDNKEKLETITVTASKRSVGVQEIPYAISAVSSKDLKNSGINNMADYAHKVPGLAISDQGNGRSQINIRGINTGEVRRDNVRASESVGVYFDDIPISAVLYNPDLEPYDIDRVEVLRGPQGTLYGSGSLAGTIRLISHAPDIEVFEGSLDVGLSSVSHGSTGHSYRGMINVPLVEDTLAARVVLYDTRQGGWIDNLAPGPGGGEDVNESNKDGGRLGLLWVPTDELSAKFTYINQSVNSGGAPDDFMESVGVDRLVEVGALEPDQTFDPSGEYEQWRYLKEYYQDDVDISNLLLTYDFENIQLTSSTSYIDRSIRVFADLSSNNLGGGYFPGVHKQPVLGIAVDDIKDITNFSQEIRLMSTDESDLQWIVGAYYSNQKVDYSQILPVLDPKGLSLDIYEPFGAPNGVVLGAEAKLKVEQLAFFGEVNYQLSDKTSVTAGLRQFDTEQSYELYTYGALNGGTTTAPTRKPKENGINPKLLISYKATDDILLSAQAARGFRLGGAQSNVPLVAAGPENDCPRDLANLGAKFDPEGFESEHLWNYEVGFKSTWANQRITFNAAAFFIDYQDLQITTRLACGSSFTTNAGGAESKGLEFEFRALATNDLQVSFGGSYTKAKFTEDLISKEAVAGDPLVFVPEWKLNASMTYTKTLSKEIDGFANLSYQYTGEIESFLDGNPSKPSRIDSKLDSYSTINLRAGIQYGYWSIALYANNLLDEYAVVRLDSSNPDGPGGWVSGATIRPRTIGANISYVF